MAKFEYLGDGNEAVYSPYFIELKEKGQVVETEDERMIEALDKHQNFKRIDDARETKKPKKRGEN